MTKISPPLAVGALIAALTLASFWGVQSHPFITLDDAGYLSANPQVRSGFTWGGVAWAFTTTYAAYWHPLTWLSHMLDVQLFGLRAGAHHLVGLFIHTANAVLLFLVLRRMSGALWRSAFVAALFAVHPLHVESVAWAAERKDLLSTLFWILTLAAYHRYARKPGRGTMGAVLIAFLFGLMAKPMLVTLPFVLLLLDGWPLGRWESTSPAPAAARKRVSALLPPFRLWQEKFPLFALAAAASVATYYAQSGLGALISGEDVPFTMRLANACNSYIFYLGKTLWPLDLSAYYPHPRAFPPWWLLGGAALLLGGISWGALRGTRRYPFLAMGWLWYLGTLLPVIGLVQAGAVGRADRFTYLPLIGIFIAAAWSLATVAERLPALKRPLAVLALAVLAALSLATRGQVDYWRDSVTLFRHALQVTTDNYIAHYNLGLALAAEGKFAEAVANYEAALRLRPQFAEIHNDLGSALTAQGRRDAAIEHYRTAIRINPRFAEASNNLGLALFAQGKIAEAIAAYTAALQIDPRFVEALNNLGVAHAARGNLEQAVAGFRAALALDPQVGDANFNLGRALALLGNLEDAVTHYRTYLSQSPRDPLAWVELGDAALRLQRVAEARDAYLRASAIDPALRGSPLCLSRGSPWCGLLPDPGADQSPLTPDARERFPTQPGAAGKFP